MSSDSLPPLTSIPVSPSPTAPTATYTASCHCGAFTYNVTASPPLDDASALVTECNCSICVKNGYLLIYVPDERIVFTQGKFEDLGSYSFASNSVGHRFCSTCGSSCMARPTVDGFMPGMTAVNVRMFKDVDVKGLKKRFADGKSL
ncbi:hypothetical protein yc1106_04255 [Curvularia clavata]|uniref:CENP-V/GFA domain-containing protein n=1 Tax=Curvularia clavata TaxID=95742 RepID=A0A9Q8Z718_CURCL|nr:hypothetical protein yc1106_04255 [Curvularia clavata]